MHPTGPNLPGQPKCGPGMIFDHAKNRCISVMAKPKKNGTTAGEDVSRGMDYGNIVRGAS